MVYNTEMRTKIAIGIVIIAAVIALFALLFVTRTHATFINNEDHCKKDCHEVSPTSIPTEEASPSATIAPQVVSSGGTGVSDGRSDGSCSQPPCITNQSGMPLQPASNSPK